ncbi:hypothetical protein [Vulgatibacter incomptus]|uniref:Peptidase, M36 (Fungalysin) family n=1 Tax=Vulgatibacter incomptus TaxID=1391653 RepID=A0A0K1P923_9BACT|nr:hypothetical protein [Vulgatibacter incomptus]AKU90007.1 Peptidase, M36 (Fungalysin) family [Vulgatibacter incomptus]
MRHLLPAFLAVMALALGACGASSRDFSGEGAGGSGGSIGSEPSLPKGGPLALAGPDAKALPGMLVRLDGRGSFPPEDARAFSVLWTQEAGPRVALSDPAALVTTFVAPSRSARETDRLVFRLTLDDGTTRSIDRLAIELVDDPAQLLPAPVVLGAADQDVRPRTRVELPAPRFADPACLAEGGDASCVSATLPFCWTQIEGAVQIDDPCDGAASFVAPDEEGVLDFKVEAHRRMGDGNRARLCSESDAGREPPFCAAPDYLRVIVRKSATRIDPPTSDIGFPDDLPRVGDILLVEREAARYPPKVKFVATMGDPEKRDNLAFHSYRALLGDAPLADLERQELWLPHGSGWPRTVAVAFEARFNRVRAAPKAAIVQWLPPTDRPPLHARARVPSSSDGFVAAGEPVVLEVTDVDHSDPDSLETCWEQVLGPEVQLSPAQGCHPGLGARSFVAPIGVSPVDLSFQVVIRDGGPLSSPPDYAVVHVAPPGFEPPRLAIAAPTEAVAGKATLLDGSASSAAGGGSLAMRWRQVWTPDSPRVDLEVTECPGAPIASAGSCASLWAPSNAVGKTIELELLATDSDRMTATRRVSIEVTR